MLAAALAAMLAAKPRCSPARVVRPTYPTRRIAPHQRRRHVTAQAAVAEPPQPGRSHASSRIPDPTPSAEYRAHARPCPPLGTPRWWAACTRFRRQWSHRAAFSFAAGHVIA
jgi:hypothetical protein